MPWNVFSFSNERRKVGGEKRVTICGTVKLGNGFGGYKGMSGHVPAQQQNE